VKKLDSRAAYLAKALALTELSPGTAEQKLRDVKFRYENASET
jgi:hypothetical protein